MFANAHNADGLSSTCRNENTRFAYWLHCENGKMTGATFPPFFSFAWRATTCHPYSRARSFIHTCHTSHTYAHTHTLTCHTHLSTHSQQLRVSDVESTTGILQLYMCALAMLTTLATHCLSLSHRHRPSHSHTNFTPLERHSPLIWIFGHSVNTQLLWERLRSPTISVCGRRR